jgi:hypothetical protein
MAQMNRTTNPTNLTRLDKKLFTVRVRTSTNGSRSFWLEHFDFIASKLPIGSLLSCVAHAGNTEEFFSLGPVEAIDQSLKPLLNLSTNRPLKFRFIVHVKGSPLLVGFIDGVRAMDEAGLLGGSLVDIEPADLGGPVWRLALPENLHSTDKPVLLVERRLFPTALAAANDPWMAVLVMPEVFRQVAMQIAANADSLDDSTAWIFPWAEFIKRLGAGEIPQSNGGHEHAEWAEDVVAGFCARTSMRGQLERAVAELGGGA